MVLKIKKKEIVLIDCHDEHCLICYQPYQSKQRVHSCPQCSQIYHHHCYLQWMISCILDNYLINCPTCRIEYQYRPFIYINENRDSK